MQYVVEPCPRNSIIILVALQWGRIRCLAHLFVRMVTDLEELKSIRHVHWRGNRPVLSWISSPLHRDRGPGKAEGTTLQGHICPYTPQNLCTPPAKASVRGGSQDHTQTFLLTKDYLSCTRHLQWCWWKELACRGSDKRQGQTYQEQCLLELNPWEMKWYCYEISQNASKHTLQQPVLGQIRLAQFVTCNGWSVCTFWFSLCHPKPNSDKKCTLIAELSPWDANPLNALRYKTT